MNTVQRPIARLLPITLVLCLAQSVAGGGGTILGAGGLEGRVAVRSGDPAPVAIGVGARFDSIATAPDSLVFIDAARSALFEKRAERWARSPFHREELPARAFYAADPEHRDALDAALFEAAWVEGLDVNEPDTIIWAAARAAMDGERLLEATEGEGSASAARAALAEFDRLLCPGVPTVVVNGERFFGKDLERVETHDKNFPGYDLASISLALASLPHQPGLTWSGRTSRITSAIICCTRRPSGAATATAWHSAGSSRSSASRQTAYTPTCGPSRSTWMTPGSERSW